MQPLSGGSVRVLGRPPARGDRRIGYIPQQRLLDASTPVRGVDLVGFGVDGPRLGLPFRRRADRERVARLVAEVGAEGFAGRPAWRLSGGEQQRLRVGQAIADDPALLLCDEPLISLDLANQAAVSGLIDRQRREHHAAVLFVTHDVNPVLEYVDRVVYLVDGRVRIGPPEEVLTSEVLSELYRTHVDVIRVHDRIVVVGAGHDPHEHRGGGVMTIFDFSDYGALLSLVTDSLIAGALLGVDRRPRRVLRDGEGPALRRARHQRAVLRGRRRRRC